MKKLLFVSLVLMVCLAASNNQTRVMDIKRASFEQERVIVQTSIRTNPYMADSVESSLPYESQLVKTSNGYTLVVAVKDIQRVIDTLEVTR